MYIWISECLKNSKKKCSSSVVAGRVESVPSKWREWESETDTSNRPLCTEANANESIIINTAGSFMCKKCECCSQTHATANSTCSMTHRHTNIHTRYPVYSAHSQSNTTNRSQMNFRLVFCNGKRINRVFALPKNRSLRPMEINRQWMRETVMRNLHWVHLVV